MLHAPIEPYDSGLLDVGDGNRIHWETAGNPEGTPVLYLHGGPGSGLGPGGYRRWCDRSRHHIIGIDQRGCGRSRPLAVDALDRIATNTTQALIADTEAVRQHLQVDRWIVTGVSWGCTLAQAYALSHPDRVIALVLMAVTTTGRNEVEWITETVGRIFPEAWHAFKAAAHQRPGERLVEAYARRLTGPDPEDHERAATAWNAWEDTHVSLITPGGGPGGRGRDAGWARNFATLVTHYWANDGFLPGDLAILPRVAEIGQIPAALIHGRQDVSGPAVTAWELHRRWPASELIIVENEGHGGPAMVEQLAAAIDRFTP
jgi:proline iminopeptidase